MKLMVIILCDYKPKKDIALMKRVISFLLLISLLMIPNPIHISALLGPDVEGRSLILMEKTTGTVLFEANSSVRIYPASTTKILSSMLMIEHIGLDEIIAIGPEIQHMPAGSSRAGHREGTHISAINLLRALIIPSGNDSGIVLATEVVRRVTGDYTLTYPEMEQLFAQMMNEKAHELGARNSNFTNPHGFHHPNHFSTPMDMALIAQAAIKNPVLAEVFAEPYYVGPGIIGDVPEGLTYSNYSWRSPNQLLHEDSEHFFPYAVGMRTGFTNHAFHALVSAATKDGFELIAGAFQSRIDVRFTDSIAMFNYGFDNYGFKHIQVDGAIVDNIPLHRPRLGEATHIDVRVEGDFIDILNRRYFDVVRQNLVFHTDRFYVPTEESVGYEYDNRPRLRLPIEEGTQIGEIIYTANGTTIHTANIYAASSASPRTMESDFYYYRDRFFEFIFSRSGIWFWVGVLIVILLIVRAIVKRIRRNRRRKIFDTKRNRLPFRYRRY